MIHLFSSRVRFNNREIWTAWSWEVWYYACHGTKCGHPACMIMNVKIVTQWQHLQHQYISHVFKHKVTQLFQVRSCFIIETAYHFLAVIKARESERERERERKSSNAQWIETHMPLHSHPLSVTASKDSEKLNCLNTSTCNTNSINFSTDNISKFSFLYILKLWISLLWCHLSKS